MLRMSSLAIAAVALVFLIAPWGPSVSAAVFLQPAASVPSSHPQGATLQLANSDTTLHAHANGTVHGHAGGAQPHSHGDRGPSGLALAAFLFGGMIFLALAAWRSARFRRGAVVAKRNS